MTRFAKVLLIAVVLAVVTVIAGVAVVAQQGQEAIFFDSATHDFTNGALTVWGNRGEGPSGAFVRFSPGNPDTAILHIHTNDTRVIGIRGAYIYRSQDGTENRVGPGQSLFIPGGVPQVSFGDQNEGAIIYEESLARFDAIAVGPYQAFESTRDSSR